MDKLVDEPAEIYVQGNKFATGNIVVVDRKYGLPELPQYALGMVIVDNATAPVRAAADHTVQHERVRFGRR